MTGGCTRCAGRVAPGERYVAIERSIERYDDDGAVSVECAETVAAYHLACAPATTANLFGYAALDRVCRVIAGLARRRLGGRHG